MKMKDVKRSFRQFHPLQWTRNNPEEREMNPTISTENPVLIIGGGNCGLAIASGLEKVSGWEDGREFSQLRAGRAGVPYVLFERDAEEDFLNKTRDWGMLLHWGDEYLKKVLPDSLATRLREATVDPHYDWKENEAFPHLDADTGQIVRYVQMPVITRVSRKRLRKFLTQNQKLNIQCNKRLRCIDLGPAGQLAVEFEDGSRARGACVIGSDGSRSRVREYLCGEKGSLVDTGLTLINHVAKYDAEQAVFLRMHHPIVKLAFSDRGEITLLAVVDASDKDHPQNWAFQVFFSWSGPPYVTDFSSPRERLHFLRENVSRFCEPWRTAVLALKDDEIVPVDRGAQFSPFRWDNRDGRITLAGDAAHAMLPHRGQGLNNAMKDASEIVDALTAVYVGKKCLNDAINAYEAEMIPRGATEVGLSSDLAHKRVNAKFEDDIVRMGWDKPEVKL